MPCLQLPNSCSTILHGHHVQGCMQARRFQRLSSSCVLGSGQVEAPSCWLPSAPPSSACRCVHAARLSRAQPGHQLTCLCMQTAENLIKQVNIYDPSLALYRDALSVVRGASLNCYSFDIMEGDSVETVASVVQRNLRIGDACTFRLIAKNVTSLLPASKRELSEETNAQLNALIE